jgi:acetyltransferase-like isoleucine patch superfamily enzyme
MQSKISISETAHVSKSNFDANTVRISSGARLNHVYMKAKKVVVNSNSILTDCKLFSEGIITIGQESIIKERTIINAFKSITIGDNTIIDRDVFIGGMQSEKSQLTVGDGSVILYRAYINTTRQVHIGDNVGIGGYCLIFTHSSWQNVLRGNPYQFASVKIKDHVWLPWNVTVLPGVVIGEGSIIGTGSVVTRSMPSAVFAAGVPARVVRKNSTKNVTLKEKNAIVLEILADFYNYAYHYLKLKQLKYDHLCGNYIISYKNERLVYTLTFKKLLSHDMVVSLSVPAKIKSEYEWLELDSMTYKMTHEISREFLSFIKRYGIRARSV